MHRTTARLCTAPRNDLGLNELSGQLRPPTTARGSLGNKSACVAQSLSDEAKRLAHDAQGLTDEAQRLAHEPQRLAHEPQRLTHEAQGLTDEAEKARA
jgi:hypothetical protein